MAAVQQSPLLPSNGEKIDAASPNGGMNTLISHGGRWYNVTSASDDSVVGERRQDIDGGGKSDGGFGASGNGVRSDQGRMLPAGIRSIQDDMTHVWQGSGQVGAELGDDEKPQSLADSYELASPLPLLQAPVRTTSDGLPTFAAAQSSQMAGERALVDVPEHEVNHRYLESKRDSQTIGTPDDSSSSVAFHSPAMYTPSNNHVRKDNFKPPTAVRTVSTPSLRRRSSAPKVSTAARDTIAINARQRKQTPGLRFHDGKGGDQPYAVEAPEPSPMPRSTMPMPPTSLPTYLQLELSSHRPSPLYIHRSAASDFPYETSRVKLERLMNFLILPPQLEQILGFGALACLDSWLFSFTILPLRFLKALSLLGDSWGHNLNSEVKFIGSFIYSGIGRVWQRNRRASLVKSPEISHLNKHHSDDDADKAFIPTTPITDMFPPLDHSQKQPKAQSDRPTVRRHRRRKSTPSALLPDHKADILKGLLIIFTCIIMMYFDPSRMYHGIRGQAAIKLYVIYNVLEVCDRLFSALGQDILECLFSKETLERKSDGHSKVLRPLGLFTLALIYNLIHATALFYQVITLNVAVNSYSNALLTLLMSNQFVEIKSTVFKKFEKENLFQITCADVVERFQLWLMLTIIASRNMVETGSLMPTSSSKDIEDFPTFLPKAFNLGSLPFLSAQVVGPYMIVLGSEMLVDWIKHAYITKFNMTKPAIYGRFLDVLCKDYYSNAFASQNLTRRLGLPVIPLACLFIRASVQTYHMFLATRTPSPLQHSSSAASSIAVPAPTALFPQSVYSFLDNTIPNTTAYLPFTPISSDALLTFFTSVLVVLLSYLTLLALKLLLGMGLLHFARNRYRGMKEREGRSFLAEGRRVGGWGVVEVDDDKKRWIYADDPDGYKKGKERETNARREAAAEGAGELSNVDRYSMVAKRIW